MTFREFNKLSPLAQFWFLNGNPIQMAYYRELLERSKYRHPVLCLRGRPIMGLVRNGNGPPLRS